MMKLKEEMALKAQRKYRAHTPVEYLDAYLEGFEAAKTLVAERYWTVDEGGVVGMLLREEVIELGEQDISSNKQ